MRREVAKRLAVLPRALTVEVTGAPRLYCAAPVWTAGLGYCDFTHLKGVPLAVVPVASVPWTFLVTL